LIGKTIELLEPFGLKTPSALSVSFAAPGSLLLETGGRALATDTGRVARLDLTTGTVTSLPVTGLTQPGFMAHVPGGTRVVVTDSGSGGGVFMFDSAAPAAATPLGQPHERGRDPGSGRFHRSASHGLRPGAPGADHL
jgi:DNA-binding beta-propeller fold protein YncE